MNTAQDPETEMEKEEGKCWEQKAEIQICIQDYILFVQKNPSFLGWHSFIFIFYWMKHKYIEVKVIQPTQQKLIFSAGEIPICSAISKKYECECGKLNCIIFAHYSKAWKMTQRAKLIA